MRARLVEVGPPTDVDRCLVERTVSPPVVPGIDSIGGQGNVIGHSEVGGREAQLRATAAVAVHHDAPHLVGPPEQLGRLLDIALGQEGPDAVEDTASCPSPVRPTPDDLEAVVAAEVAQELDVAPPAVAEVEVLADDDEAGRQLVDQHLLDEVLGRLLGPGQVERNDHGAVDAALGQQLQLLLEAGQLLGRRLGDAPPWRDGGRT